MAAEPQSLLQAIVAAILAPLRDALRKPPPEPEERESVWSVSKGNRSIFFAVTFLMWATSIAYFAYDTPWGIPPEPPNPPPPQPKPTPEWQIIAGHIETIVARFSRIVVGLTAIGMALTPLIRATGRFIVTLAERITQRWVTPYIEKYRAEGIAEGRAEGREAERAAWREWNRRRQAAAARNEPFHEPPPDEA